MPTSNPDQTKPCSVGNETSDTRTDNLINDQNNHQINKSQDTKSRLTVIDKNNPTPQDARLTKFDVCLVKALPRRRSDGTTQPAFYGKCDFKKTEPFPFLNDIKVLSPKTFYDLFLLLKKIINNPQFCQVLGHPASGKDFLRATPRRLDYLSHYEPEAHLYDYLFLEIDDLADSDIRTYEFEQAYLSHTLTPIIIEKQARYALKRIFHKTSIHPQIPLIVRLSSSFYKTPDPRFKAHIYVPSPNFFPPSLPPIAKYISPVIDPATTRSPNQPIYTSAPVFKELKDPLLDNKTPLQRIYFFGDQVLARSNQDLPSINLPTHFEEEIKATLKNKPERMTALLPSWELDGDPGLFNKQAHEGTSDKTVESWLLEQGYQRESQYRWLSPTSETKSAGTMILSGGYVYEFHENTPLKTLSPHRRIHTAYDLYRLSYHYEGRAPEFQDLILSMRARDPDFKSRSFETIMTSMSFIDPILDGTELDIFVQGLVTQTFQSRMDAREKESILEEIVSRTKKCAKPFKKKDLNLLWKSLVSDLARKIGNVDPSNADQVNADSFLKRTPLFFHPVEKYYLIKHPIDPLIVAPTSEDLDVMIETHLLNISTSPDWQSNKIGTTLQRIKASAKIQSLKDPDIIPSITSTKMKFLDSSYAIDLITKEIGKIGMNEYISAILPFTLEDYQEAVQTPDPFWKQFVTSSLPKAEDQLLLKKIYGYVFSPIRKEQIVVFFYGAPRSGKSTFKNVLTHFFKIFEFSANKITDNFILSDFTPLDRAIVVNEFNANTTSRSVLEKVVNVVKEISGRDKIKARGLFEEYRGFLSDAVPILISNQPPIIKDQAFQSRVIPIRFNNTFNNSSSEFQASVTNCLPTAFAWTISQLSEKHKTVSFQDKRTQDTVDKNSTEILAEIDFLKLFCKRYVTEGILDAKDPDRKHIVKNSFKHYLVKFFESIFDAPWPESFPAHFPTVRDLKKIFPGYVISKSKYQPKDAENSLQVFKGIRWKNFARMSAHLSEFNEYSEGQEFND